MEQSHLSIRGIDHSYGPVTALSDVSLGVARGEVVALLGESGSGKSTLLAAIAGLIRPARGSIALGGREISTLAPERRNLGMVFQDYALWPHLKVFDQVAFPLRRRRVRGEELRRRVDAALERVGLGEFRDRRVTQLSGGQQQRVALARAVVAEPELLLLDEPLSALDPETRAGVRARLRQDLRDLGITSIVVTHDQDDALELADRIAVLYRGTVAQFAPPRELFQRPRGRGIAEFLGLALFEGQAVADGVLIGDCHLPLEHSLPPGPALLSIPQARLSLAPRGSDGMSLPAELVGSRYLGGAWQLLLRPRGQRRAVQVTSLEAPGPGPHEVHADLNDLHLMGPEPE